MSTLEIVDLAKCHQYWLSQFLILENNAIEQGIGVKCYWFEPFHLNR